MLCVQGAGLCSVGRVQIAVVFMVCQYSGVDEKVLERALQGCLTETGF